VCPVEGSGISTELYSDALEARFDFVVTDENYDPQFAVESDGPSHDAEDTKALDEACRRGP
jgi:hypothetical protein